MSTVTDARLSRGQMWYRLVTAGVPAPLTVEFDDTDAPYVNVTVDPADREAVDRWHTHLVGQGAEIIDAPREWTTPVYRTQVRWHGWTVTVRASLASEVEWSTP